MVSASQCFRQSCFYAKTWAKILRGVLLSCVIPKAPYVHYTTIAPGPLGICKVRGWCDGRNQACEVRRLQMSRGHHFRDEQNTAREHAMSQGCSQVVMTGLTLRESLAAPQQAESRTGSKRPATQAVIIILLMTINSINSNDSTNLLSTVIISGE